MKEPDQNELMQRGELPADPEDGAGPPVPLPILDAAEARRAATPAEPARRKSLAEAYDAAAEVMLSRARGVVRPIPTPWEGFNRRLRGGLWPGLAVLTSNTGSGKTQFAVQLVISAARHFREEQIRTGAEHADRALYIALELGEVDLTARVVGLLSGARWSDLYHGDYDPEGLCRLGERPDPNHLALLFENHRPTVADLPIDVDTADAMRWTWQDLQKVGEEKRPPRLIVLDYTQLARAPANGPREELRQTIAASALVGRDLARRHGIAVLAISSTARSNYGKVSGKGERGKAGERAFPVIPGETDSDVDEYIDIGKDAGELEYTADVSFALVRDPEPLQEQSLNERRAPSMVWPAIAKGRGIGAGWAPPVMFDGHCFTEATPAQITARKMGVDYSPSMLDEPDYNMRLGSSFLGQLVGQRVTELVGIGPAFALLGQAGGSGSRHPA